MRGRRRGKRSGVSSRAVGDVAGRMRLVRALWFAVHNDPSHTVAELSVEFYFAVGQVIEGRGIDALELHQINRERVVQHARE